MQLRTACAQESAVLLLLGWLCGVLAHRGHSFGVNHNYKRVNKHKPWIETSYHGTITENNDTVFLDPPLVALDKDAPVRYAEEHLNCVFQAVLVTSECDCWLNQAYGWLCS